jgi:hypothetical protein
VIVGSNGPNSVALVIGTNGESRYAIPPSIKPERGQRPENVSEPSTKQLCDVFHNDDRGVDFTNEAMIFPPQTAALTFEASALARKANVLAGEPADDNVNGNSIGSKDFSGEFADIIVNPHSGKLVLHDALAERQHFAERDGPEPACSFEAKVKTSDSGE